MKKLGKFKGATVVKRQGSKAVLQIGDKYAAVKMWRGGLFDNKGNFVSSADELNKVTKDTARKHFAKM